MTDLDDFLAGVEALAERCRQRLEMLQTLTARDIADPNNLHLTLTTISNDMNIMSASLEVLAAIISDARKAGRL